MALLRCSVMSSMGGSRLAFPTITDGRSTNSAAPPADTRRVCACTFYLVFKEPDCSPGDAKTRAAELFPLRRRPSLGEPSNLTRRPGACQPPDFRHDYRRACRGIVEPRSASFSRLARLGRPADRAGATHYTITRIHCQPGAAPQPACFLPRRTRSSSAVSYRTSAVMMREPAANAARDAGS
jgi:hypothetical protein